MKSGFSQLQEMSRVATITASLTTPVLAPPGVDRALDPLVEDA
jgi:hypothetical protein